MKRVKAPAAKSEGGSYFAAPKPSVDFINTGSTLLDHVLGGGWPLGRMANIVGDKSTGKSLLAIEASANFANRYDGRIYYREAEAAFDPGYAAALGMPVDRIDFGRARDGSKRRFDTVEDIFEDLTIQLGKITELGTPGLYIVDSLDALSDRAEMDRDIDEGSYNLTKQKRIGELFRKRVREIEDSAMSLIIISQVRDKIGVSFGEKYTRSGGKAMDFYASQIVWLSHIATLTKTVRGEKRATGVRVKAKCKKNKIGLPFREADFVIRFGFGIDDLQSNLEWLKTVNRLGELDIAKDGVTRSLDTADEMSDTEYREFCNSVSTLVGIAWHEIETSFLPTRKKY